MKAGGSDLRQVLQLEEHLGIGVVTVPVHHCFALLVVLGKRPRTDSLSEPGPETRAAVGVEDIARFRLVQNRPDLQAFSQFPAAPMKHCAATRELRRLALVPRALGKKVKSLLA